MSIKAALAPEDNQADLRFKKTVERATIAFADKRLRFTDLRKKVFEEIAATQSAIGAYDILERLAVKGTRLAPISIYRALDALLEAGVVHRLESKNAYFACRRLHNEGKRQLAMSCEKCSKVYEVEAEAIFETIDRVARASKFEPRVKFVEVSGTCAACQNGKK